MTHFSILEVEAYFSGALKGQDFDPNLLLWMTPRALRPTRSCLVLHRYIFLQDADWISMCDNKI
jgi:hypothetical protein